MLTQRQFQDRYQIPFNIDNIKQFKLVFPHSFSNVYDYAILCHSEKNSDNLTLYENSGYIGVYWWAHAVIARDWYRHAEHDLDLEPNFNNITKDFLIYNRAWTGTREYRLTFAEMLVDQNLVNCCNIKFSTVDNNCHYTKHVFANNDLKIFRQDLENFFKTNTADSNSSADYEARDYLTSGIEIVLETLFDDGRHHLTEKLLRPIACGRPFILVSTAGSLDYLKGYGFETFNEFIDESYDNITDPKKRLHAIVREMKRISSLDHKSKQKLWDKIYSIAHRNKLRFFSNIWQTQILDEYKNNFISAMQFLKKHRSAHNWKLVGEISEINQELKQRRSQDGPGGRVAGDVEFIDNWLANPPN